MVYFSVDKVFGEIITMEGCVRGILRTVLENLPLDRQTLEDILYSTNGLDSAL